MGLSLADKIQGCDHILTVDCNLNVVINSNSASSIHIHAKHKVPPGST